MNRSCGQCHAPLPVQKGRHQPRKFCTTCRPPRNRGKSAATVPVTPVNPPKIREIRPGAAEKPQTLTEASEARLRDAGRLSDPSALVVLAVARSIEEGGHSGASLAALSREFRAALASALDGVEAEVADDGVSWGVG